MAGGAGLVVSRIVLVFERIKQMSNAQTYEALEADYGTDTFRRTVSIKSSKLERPSHGRRRGKGPQPVNGIHKRRKRKMAW